MGLLIITFTTFFYRNSRQIHGHWRDSWIVGQLKNWIKLICNQSMEKSLLNMFNPVEYFSMETIITEQNTNKGQFVGFSSKYTKFTIKIVGGI